MGIIHKEKNEDQHKTRQRRVQGRRKATTKAKQDKTKTNIRRPVQDRRKGYNEGKARQDKDQHKTRQRPAQDRRTGYNEGKKTRQSPRQEKGL
jgi:hypothetical protein